MERSGELSAPAVLRRRALRQSTAMDLRDRRGDRPQIWRTPVETDPAVGARHAYARSPAAGPTLYNGKLYGVNIDNYVVALDMKTGKEVWKQKFAAGARLLRHRGRSWQTASDLGMAAANPPHVDPRWLGPETRRSSGRRYTMSGRRRAGHEDWPADNDSWTRRLARDWRSGSVRSAARPGLIGVSAMPSPTTPRPRRRLDSLFTSSVLAIRPKTGEIVCPFHIHTDDLYDVRRRRRARAGRPAGRRQRAQGDDPGQQERLPVRARPTNCSRFRSGRM